MSRYRPSLGERDVQEDNERDREWQRRGERERENARAGWMCC